MLTPVSVKNHEFQLVGRGFYKASEVDEYFAQVLVSFEQAFKDNKELVRKLNLIASKLDDYKDDEENIRQALLNAQGLAERIINDAKYKAKDIISSAEDKAANVDELANEKIREMIRDVEGQIKDTFAEARRQSRKITENAETEAGLLIQNAKKKAAEIVDGSALMSRNELETILKEIEIQRSYLNGLKENAESFKNDLLLQYEEQVEVVKKLPDFTVDNDEETERYAEYDERRMKIQAFLDSIISDETDNNEEGGSEELTSEEENNDDASPVNDFEEIKDDKGVPDETKQFSSIEDEIASFLAEKKTKKPFVISIDDGSSDTTSDVSEAPASENENIKDNKTYVDISSDGNDEPFDFGEESFSLFLDNGYTASSKTGRKFDRSSRRSKRDDFAEKQEDDDSAFGFLSDSFSDDDGFDFLKDFLKK